MSTKIRSKVNGQPATLVYMIDRVDVNSWRLVNALTGEIIGYYPTWLAAFQAQMDYEATHNLGALADQLNSSNQTVEQDIKVIHDYINSLR